MQQYTTPKKINFYKMVLLRITGLITTTALIIYACIRLLFTGFDISITEDLFTIMQVIGLAAALSAGAFILFLLVEAADMLQPNLKLNQTWAGIGTAVTVLVISVASCKTKVSSGVKKDLNTGMVTKYSGIETQDALLVMNNETIHHTDIPLGESFQVINDKITGFETENNQVKVGCSLKITDKKGTVLLEQPDLFASKDVFSVKEAGRLSCTVSTGAPMQWDEAYDVTTVFWDKLGSGKIENMLSIHIIDIP